MLLDYKIYLLNNACSTPVVSTAESSSLLHKAKLKGLVVRSKSYVNIHQKNIKIVE
jgi:hypothetical protein